jgi:predicted transposase/invertase (TIGR01784 family)
MIKERLPDEKKALSFRGFAYNILGIDKMDIDPKVKEVWKMQFRPVDEVVKELYIRDAKQEGWQEGKKEGKKEGKEDMAKGLLADGVPPEIIAKNSGLPLDTVKALMH